MSGRHRPEAGADSGYPTNHYRVLVEEHFGGRLTIDVPAAIGPKDAEHQAVEKAIDRGYLDVTAIRARLVTDEVPAEATFDEWIDWAGLR